MITVASLDSSRDLQPIHTKSFINRLHLVLHVCVKIFDVTFFLFTELEKVKMPEEAPVLYRIV